MSLVVENRRAGRQTEIRFFRFMSAEGILGGPNGEAWKLCLRIPRIQSRAATGHAAPSAKSAACRQACVT